jgi:hypothetical protein
MRSGTRTYLLGDTRFCNAILEHWWTFWRARQHLQLLVIYTALKLFSDLCPRGVDPKPDYQSFVGEAKNARVISAFTTTHPKQ